jgi:hypothetical protein
MAERGCTPWVESERAPGTPAVLECSQSADSERAARITVWARFEGDVVITGKLMKGSGTFRIDHPLDPANKYLLHLFVESPDMMNIYNGNITTDANGDL